MSMSRLFVAVLMLATFPALATPAAFRDCPDCPEMVAVPAGRFVMGSPPEERAREGVPALFGDREQPQHLVVIARPFAMSRTEITRGQFARFAAATQRPLKIDCQTFDPARDSWVGSSHPSSWEAPGFPQTDLHPAACMTWQDASDYADWLSRTTGHAYRLPSDAEWEYAARGGGAGARWWGDDIQPVCARLHIMSAATVAAIGHPKSWSQTLVCSDGPAWTIPVASHAPNGFGLYDMLGSLWEWSADCWHPNYVGAPTDGSAWAEPDCALHALRGGAFHSQYWLARSATRGKGMAPDFRPIAAGIRLVRTLP